MRFAAAPVAETARRLAQETKAELDRIIAWWHGALDAEQGGFVGEIDAAGVHRPEADKAVILNTRLLWFFSAAAQRTGDALCFERAQRAGDYIGEHFLDRGRGGLFWMLDANGAPVSRRKQAYAQAFGVYAFAAHFAATGQRPSLDTALALFEILETHFRDREAGGYWEAREEDFAPIADMRLSEQDLNAPKTMNTHLHVLEAYTALHLVSKDARVGAALQHVLEIMLDRICDPASGHLHLFFDRDWNSLDETVSFGHDIEASWLMCEAADALGAADLRAKARASALRLVEATLAQGIGPHGEVFEARHGDGALSSRRIWWIQAEALVGFLNAFELSGDGRYGDAALQSWRFIQQHLIDRDGGEWRASSLLDPAPAASELRAGPWKCPYHTGRAMIEAERRAASLFNDHTGRPARAAAQ